MLTKKHKVQLPERTLDFTEDPSSSGRMEYIQTILPEQNEQRCESSKF